MPARRWHDGLLKLQSGTLTLCNESSKLVRKTSKFDEGALGPSQTIMIDHFEVEVRRPSGPPRLWLRDPCEKQIFAEETKGINSGTYFMESNVGPAAPSRKKIKSMNGADSTPDSGEVAAAESVQTGLFDPEAEGALVLLNTPTAVVVVDPYISRTLREHQRAGVRFM
jgi:hypothetical protein